MLDAIAQLVPVWEFPALSHGDRLLCLMFFPWSSSVPAWIW